MSPTEADARAPDGLVRAALVLLFAIVATRDAWVGDDAYITLRTVDHLVSGRGLVWNVGERVQAYTHPLWLFVLAPLYAVTREGWYTLVLPSLACSVAAVVVFATRLVPAGPAGWAVLALLPLSRVFVDWSTSGLENPLTHLLLVAALAVWFSPRGPRTVGALAALTGLALTNRLDTALLFGPLLAVAAWDERRAGRRLAGSVALGLAPFLAWEAFSLVYYGALVPNTAIAKLGAGIPRQELAWQGLFYLVDGLERDPLTMAVLAGGLALPFVVRDRPGMVAAAGGLLYVLYVVRIGGDFMAGRFLAAPFVVAAACLARMPANGASAAAFATMAVLLSVSASAPTLTPPRPAFDPGPDARGIADERAYYAFTGNGLVSASRAASMPAHGWVAWGERVPRHAVVVLRAPGMRGFSATPTTLIVDPLGLTDAFLARLPARYDPDWRIGHFERAVPVGYLDTLATGDDHLEDPDLSALYGAVSEVIRGPLWSAARWRAIAGLLAGRYRFDADRYRFADAVPFEVGPPDRPTDAAIDRPDAVALEATGAKIALGTTVRLPRVLVRRASYLDLDVLFYRNGVRVAESRLPREVPNGAWLTAGALEVPAEALDPGYDALRLVPVGGPRPWVLLSVEPTAARPAAKDASGPRRVFPGDPTR